MIESISEIFRILADQNRLRIVCLLERRRMCVCELAAVLGITQPAISRHLRKMKAQGLVGSVQQGLWTDYFLRMDAVPFAAVLAAIKPAMKDDPLIKADRARLRSVDRNKLCGRA